MSKITIEHEGRTCTVEQDDVTDIYRLIDDLVLPALVGAGFSETLAKEALGYDDE